MGKILLQYFLSFSIFLIIGIILLDYIILPNYVGYNNEHYLPDIRGEYQEKAAELESIPIDDTLIMNNDAKI